MINNKKERSLAYAQLYQKHLQEKEAKKKTFQSNVIDLNLFRTSRRIENYPTSMTELKINIQEINQKMIKLNQMFCELIELVKK